MWTKIAATILAVGTAGVLASASRPGPAPIKGVNPLPSEAERKLDDRLDVFRCDGTFQQAIQELRDKTGANIVVQWRRLEEGGITADWPVRLQLHDLTLAEVLDHVLKSAETLTASMGYTVDDGAIVITAGQSLSDSTITRVYEVRDLIAAGMKQPPEGPGLKWEDAVEKLTNAIVDGIDQDSWRDAGGSIGSVRELNGRLVITQSLHGHRKLAELLAALRAPPTGGIKFPTTRKSQPEPHP